MRTGFWPICAQRSESDYSLAILLFPPSAKVGLIPRFSALVW